MADIKGAYFPLPGFRGTSTQRKVGRKVDVPYKGGGLYKGKPANYKFYPFPIGPEITFRMRAWNTITVDWEIWTSVGAPDPDPPSGDPVTGVTVIGAWEA